MTIFCLLFRSVRRYSTTATFQTPIFAASNQTLNDNLDTQSPSQSFSAAASYTNPYQSPISTTNNNTTTNILNHQFETTSSSSTPVRSYGFSSAEEAAAERRVRIEPPLYALRSNPALPKPNDPNKPSLPDSSSALVGSRLNLHNRVQSLIRAGDLDSASYIARQSVFQSPRPTVFTCNAIIAAMYRAKRYDYAKALFQYFFNQFDVIPNIVSYNNLIECYCGSNDIEEALNVYNHLLENAPCPYAPSPVTYQNLTKGLVEAGRINDAEGLLREMLQKGYKADPLVYGNLILGYFKLGNSEKGLDLHYELLERLGMTVQRQY